MYEIIIVLVNKTLQSVIQFLERLPTKSDTNTNANKKKYTLHQRLTTSDLFTYVKSNQYWWQLPN